jgi:hypothetical protein
MDENTAIIYLRGGDIFSTCIHPLYWSPPLIHFVNIIDSNNFTEITLVSEDKLNPVVNTLLAKYPHIKYKKNSLAEDIKIILSARNIIYGGFTTFMMMLLRLSIHKKKVYTYSDKPYIKIMRPWANSQYQRQIMLTYGFPKISNAVRITQKCARHSCNYKTHSNKQNNTLGLYCCRACENDHKHGPLCEKNVFENNISQT